LSFVVRWLFWLLMIALVVGGSVFVLWPQPIEVDLATVGIGPLQVTIDEDGMTRIRERYVVSSPVAGRLVRIDLEPGDPIMAGSTLLATIQPSDPSMLDARQVAEAEARAAAARIAIDRAAARVEQARSEKEVADSQYRRAHELWEKNGMSDSDYELAQGEAKIRAEQLRAAEFDQEIAKYEAQQAEAALLRLKPASDGAVDEGQFEVFAPINGHVLRVLQESATVVSAGSPLLEVGDRNDLEVVVDVLSTDAVKIQPGNAVRLEDWGGPNPLRATVRTVEPAAFTKISALGVEEQRVNVVADFDSGQPDVRSLGDGFRVEARIIVWQEEKALKVPSNALFRGSEQWFVFVNRHRVAHKQAVEIGQSNSRETEVLSGLNEGDSVVLYPSDLVVEGVKLTSRTGQ
jgi:HlyD family secretion protein